MGGKGLRLTPTLSKYDATLFSMLFNFKEEL